MEPTRSLRVVFLGNDPWSVPCLEALADSSHELALVVTRVPRPAGRGSKLTPTAVADAARVMGLPMREVETVKRDPGLRALAETAPDVLVVVAYGEILPLAVLRLPRVAPVNLHFSLLPRLRGANPVRAALLEGSSSTGVTTMVVDEGLDTGPVLLQATEPILDDDDAGTLGERLARLGAGLLVRTLDGIAAGWLAPRPQDDDEASYAPKLVPGDRVLDWSRDAEALVRQVRALAPEPGASTTFRGSSLKVFRSQAAPVNGLPGEVLGVDRSGFLVGTGAGSFRPLELAPAGRRRMAADAFVRGYRPTEGERFG